MMDIYMNNITYSNDLDIRQGHLVTLFGTNTRYHINGIRFINAGGIAISLRDVYEVTINDLSFENYTAIMPFIADFIAEKKVEFNGVSFKNIDDPGEYTSALFIFTFFGDSQFIMRNMQFQNATFRNRRGVFFPTATAESTFMIDNVT